MTRKTLLLSFLLTVLLACSGSGEKKSEKAGDINNTLSGKIGSPTGSGTVLTDSSKWGTNEPVQALITDNPLYEEILVSNGVTDEEIEVIAQYCITYQDSCGIMEEVLTIVLGDETFQLAKNTLAPYIETALPEEEPTAPIARPSNPATRPDRPARPGQPARRPPPTGTTCAEDPRYCRTPPPETAIAPSGTEPCSSSGSISETLHDSAMAITRSRPCEPPPAAAEVDEEPATTGFARPLADPPSRQARWAKFINDLNASLPENASKEPRSTRPAAYTGPFEYTATTDKKVVIINDLVSTEENNPNWFGNSEAHNNKVLNVALSWTDSEGEKSRNWQTLGSALKNCPTTCTELDLDDLGIDWLDPEPNSEELSWPIDPIPTQYKVSIILGRWEDVSFTYDRREGTYWDYYLEDFILCDNRRIHNATHDLYIGNQEGTADDHIDGTLTIRLSDFIPSDGYYPGTAFCPTTPDPARGAVPVRP
ncbi:MAG: hypothetical protein Q7S00_01525 [bacterium]|nr:hypothetical protein [bacterium]